MGMSVKKTCENTIGCHILREIVALSCMRVLGQGTRILKKCPTGIIATQDIK